MIIVSQTCHACIGHHIGVNSFIIYDFRLGNSSTSPATSGRVEILTYRGWMPICASSWDSSDSRVLCRQLGYSYSTYSKKMMTRKHYYLHKIHYYR